MRNLVKLLIVPLLAFFSCSQQIDGIWEEKEIPQESEVHPVSVRFSKADVEGFVGEGISEVGIYVYMSDSLVYGKTLSLDGSSLEIPLPLGENLQTFAVANADELVDVDSLSKVIIYQHDNMQKPVYISEIIGFTSDNSVSTLSLELKRLVGQAVFQPKESDEEMDAVTNFDALDITFTNVGIGYKVKSKECILGNVTVRTDRNNGFSASVYSFPTFDTGSLTSINVVYLKNSEEVNRLVGVLDTGISFVPSKRSTVHMDFLNEDFLDVPWNVKTHTVRMMHEGKLEQPFTILESEF